MTKKILGIFYKDVILQLHYIPLSVIVLLILNGTAHLFGFGFHIIHNLWFNLSLFLSFFIGLSLTDQIVHAVLNLFGVKD